MKPPEHHVRLYPHALAFSWPARSLVKYRKLDTFKSQPNPVNRLPFLRWPGWRQHGLGNVRGSKKCLTVSYYLCDGLKTKRLPCIASEKGVSRHTATLIALGLHKKTTSSAWTPNGLAQYYQSFLSSPMLVRGCCISHAWLGIKQLWTAISSFTVNSTAEQAEQCKHGVFHNHHRHPFSSTVEQTQL